MITLNLNNLAVAFIDDEDAYVLETHDWYLADRGWVKYVQGNDRKTGFTILLHRLILKPSDEQIVDHKDRNGLNNVRSNLRIATFTENSHNIKKRKDGRVPFKGVGQNGTQKFRAKITKDGKVYYLGYFDNPIDAAKAYDKAAIELYGEFATTNLSLGLLADSGVGRTWAEAK